MKRHILPRLFGLSGLLVALAATCPPAAAAMNMSMGGTAALPVAGKSLGGPFALTDQSGRAVTDRDYPGFKLVYFGYTGCPDACPLDLQKMAVALRRLEPGVARPPVLFITTDPARDTPAKLKNYLQPFAAGADGLRVIGLTGTPAQLAATEKAYGVTVETVWNRTRTDYMINHTTFIYLIGPDGKLRDAFGSGDDADHIAASLRTDLVAP